MAKWRDIKQNRVTKNSKSNNLNSTLNHSIDASLSSRLKAFLTDTFLITTPIFYIVIYLIMGSGEGFAQNRSLGWSVILTIHFIIVAIFWLKNGQTPGLKAYGIRLVDSKTLKRVSVLQVFIRYFSTTISLISIFLLFIPYLNKDKKTFQDIVSNTKIIDEKNALF